MPTDQSAVTTRIPLPEKFAERCSCAFLEVGQTWESSRPDGQFFPVRTIVRIDADGITYDSHGRTRSVGFASLMQWMDFYEARRVLEATDGT